MIYVLLVSSGLLNGIAQLFWKVGLGGLEVSVFNFSFFVALLKNRPFMLGLILYAVSILIRFVVLSKVEVSFAYPFIALAYVVVVLGGYYLGEDINALRLLGIAFILAGIVFVSQS